MGTSIARWRITALVAMAICAIAVGGCGLDGARPPIPASPIDETMDGDVWPDGVVESVSGPAAYGWQLCRSGEAQQSPGAPWGTGAFNPSEGVGLQARSDVGDRIERLVWNDPSLLERTDPSIDWRPVSVGGYEPLTQHHISLEPLRTVEGVRRLFDFDAITVDVLQPGVEVPLVEVLPLVEASDGDGPVLRIEGLPSAWLSSGFDGGEGVVAVTTLDRYVSVVWLVEVWADGTKVERVRFQTQDGGAEAVEVRFLEVADVLSDGDLVRPDCSADDDEVNNDWVGFEPWAQSRTVPLKVTLDADGRPYDAEADFGRSTRRSHVGQLTAEAGELLVMDGSAIEVNPQFFADGVVSLSVAPDDVVDGTMHVVNVDVLWEVWPELDGRPGWESVLGVWLGPADAEVAAWDPFEHAYTTDGGSGGVISRAGAEAANDLGDTMWVPDRDYEADYGLFDRDGEPGFETFIFSNGWGDGGFPMSRGRDEDGEVVAAVIWRTDMPWRMAIPVGIPPSDVRQREDALLQCIEGTREILPTGDCSLDS